MTEEEFKQLKIGDEVRILAVDQTCLQLEDVGSVAEVIAKEAIINTGVSWPIIIDPPGDYERQYMRLDQVELLYKTKHSAKHGMTIEEAMKEAYRSIKFEIGDQEFTMVKWTSPYDGKVEGPLIVANLGTTAIEVTPNGVFKEAIPLTADCYSPYIEVGDKND